MNYELEDFAWLAGAKKRALFAKKGTAFMAILAIVLSAVPVLLVPSVAHASTLTLHPSAVGPAGANDWSGSPTNTDAGKVSATQTNDDDTSYAFSSGSATAIQTFQFASAGLVAGTTINSVTLSAVAKGVGSGNKKYTLTVRNGAGTFYNDPAEQSAGSTYATINYIMATNPSTGLPWTLSEVNTWTTTFGLRRTNAAGEIRATEIYLTIDYTAVIDTDGDGIADTSDNCPVIANADQANNDNDSLGDVCDPDDDNDGVLDAVPDNCPLVANADQTDTNDNGVGDACDGDDDGDGVVDGSDNCPLIANADQLDTDQDGLGDVCDTDDDNDGDLDDADNCPLVANADQADNDNDGIGDACDPDDDNDTILDGLDNCQMIANTDQADTDEDGIGNVCDSNTDSDDDGIADEIDNCPSIPNADQADADEDGIGDVCDNDADNDGIVDGEDNCVNNANADQVDTDGDGQGNVCDETPNGQATLIVKKIVINDNNGESSAASFSFVINSLDPVAFEADGQNDVTVTMGTYTVTEPAVAGYTATYENCTAVVLANGGAATCTITNNDNAPTDGQLTVTKVVSGGTKVVADFPLFVGETAVTSGVQATFTAGTYTVSETNQTGYTAVFSGDCNASGGVTVVAGEAKTCTITNTFTAPTDTDADAIPDSSDNCPLDANTGQADNDEDGIGNVCDSTPDGTPSGGGGSSSSGSSTQYIITSTAGAGGTITPLGSYYALAGSNYSLTITPDSGFQVASVLVDGISVGPVTNYTFSIVTANHTISASFQGVAGASTTVFQPDYSAPGTGAGAGGTTGGTTEETGQVAGDETEGSTTEETTPKITEETNLNQPAALSGATGLGPIWDWLKMNWPWWVILLIILLLLYWWFTQIQKDKKNQPPK